MNMELIRNSVHFTNSSHAFSLINYAPKQSDEIYLSRAYLCPRVPLKRRSHHILPLQSDLFPLSTKVHRHQILQCFSITRFICSTLSFQNVSSSFVYAGQSPFTLSTWVVSVFGVGVFHPPRAMVFWTSPVFFLPCFVLFMNYRCFVCHCSAWCDLFKSTFCVYNLLRLNFATEKC